MRPIECISAALLVALIILLAGCGAGTDSRGTGSSTRKDSVPGISGGRSGVTRAKAASSAKAEEVQYFGRRAFKLTNGLVSVIAVPDLGGRVLEYNLGDYAFLWANKAELGGSQEGSADATAASAWRNYGGYKVWPAPQKDWGGPPDPKGSELDGGRWQGKIVTASGPAVVVEMTSPDDPQVTGLRITRQLTLHVGTTRLEVKETFRNVSQRSISWAIWGITQVPGAVTPNGPPSADSRVYFPVNPDSAHAGGFIYLLEDKGQQWKKVANDRIVQTSYAGKAAKIGADSVAGWIASVNEDERLSLVQTFQPKPGAQYPDSGSIVQVYTSPADLNYMEMEINSPITQLKPGEDFSFTQNWFCTSVGGPLLKVTGAGAVKVHPTAARKGNQIVVTGELGVFAPGEAVLVLSDADGKKLQTSKPVKVSPTGTVKLNITAPLPDATATAMIVLNDEKGGRVGNLAEVPLGSAVAKKPSGN